MTKIKIINKTITIISIILLLFTLCGCYPQSKHKKQASTNAKYTKKKKSDKHTFKYSVDDNGNKSKNRKKAPKLSKDEKREMRAEGKAINKDKKGKKRRDKQHKRQVKKHNKKVSGAGREVSTDQKVYKRMRKSKKNVKKGK